MPVRARRAASSELVLRLKILAVFLPAREKAQRTPRAAHSHPKHKQTIFRREKISLLISILVRSETDTVSSLRSSLLHSGEACKCPRPAGRTWSQQELFHLATKRRAQKKTHRNTTAQAG